MKPTPLVSIFLCTYNRPEWLRRALTSCVLQYYPEIEIIVCRDGGKRVNIDGFLHVHNTPLRTKILFINSDENKGLARRYNEMLKICKGEYICYLGDDDFYYPNHVQALVDLSNDKPDSGVYYSDLYQTHYEGDADDFNVVTKNLAVCREFDRLAMFQYNTILSMAAMHRKSCVEQVGGYLETRGLVDWGIHRRLAHITDFEHTHKITGEYYAQLDWKKQDRISKKIRETDEVLHICEIIRNDRPPKPWIVPDIGINICGPLSERLVSEIRTSTLWPFKIFDNAKDEEMDVDIIAHIPNNTEIPADEVAWIEKAAWPIIQGKGDCYKIPRFEGIIYKKGSKSEPKDCPRNLWPLQYEHAAEEAKSLYRKGFFREAIHKFQECELSYNNVFWARRWQAAVFYAQKQWAAAIGLLFGLNSIHPIPYTLEIQAKCHDKLGEIEKAKQCRLRADQIMSIKGPDGYVGRIERPA